MISEFDEYAVHQTTNPIAHPGPSNRNFYDRYWFGGFADDAEYHFEAGFGLYPNRSVQDGHFSVVVDGVQHSFHGSRRAPDERADSRIGPLSIEVVQPLRAIRVRLEPNDSGIECNLLFRGHSTPTEEPKNVMYEGTRLLMENSRFTQLGAWEGHFQVAGRRTEVRAERTTGTRDRSWGIRPVGEPEAGAPGKLNGEPGVYWIWAPLHFQSVCTQFGSFEDRDGRPTQKSACIVPRYRDIDTIPRGVDPGHREMQDITHTVQWQPGTRWPKAAKLDFDTGDGEKVAIELEAIGRFQMQGIGYQHPEWAHGVWKGELETGAESWKLADLDPLDYKNIHVHTACRATMVDATGTHEGVGILETICFGRHSRSGFKDILDGAP